MKTIRPSSFDEFAEWFIERERRKGGTAPAHSSPADRVEVMRTWGKGMFNEWYLNATWSICRLHAYELGRVFVQKDQMMIDEGLVDQRGPRMLWKAAENARKQRYFETPRPGRERHHEYCRRLRAGDIVLEDGDRLFLRSVEENEAWDIPNHQRSVTLVDPAMLSADPLGFQ